MKNFRTPCIGICSTTSFGDKICRGCKRFSNEVIAWNGYSDQEKQAVLSRIDQLTTQIVSAKFNIYSVRKLQQVMDDFRFFYNPALSPYCWLHNLLQKNLHRLQSLDEIGVRLNGQFVNTDIRDLLITINQELVLLSEAHHERYFKQSRAYS